MTDNSNAHTPSGQPFKSVIEDYKGDWPLDKRTKEELFAEIERAAAPTAPPIEEKKAGDAEGKAGEVPKKKTNKPRDLKNAKIFMVTAYIDEKWQAVDIGKTCDKLSMVLNQIKMLAKGHIKQLDNGKTGKGRAGRPPASYRKKWADAYIKATEQHNSKTSHPVGYPNPFQLHLIEKCSNIVHIGQFNRILEKWKNMELEPPRHVMIDLPDDVHPKTIQWCHKCRIQFKHKVMYDSHMEQH